MKPPMVLKQLREELHMQQKELAELLRVNVMTVNRWETGRTQPTKAAGNLLLRVARESGASEVCIASLEDVLFPKPDLEEKTNDIRHTEIDSINQLLNESPNGVIVIDYDNYDILYMNNKMIESTGISMEEAPTKKCYQLFAGEEHPCDICHEGEKRLEGSSESAYPSTIYGKRRGKYYAIRSKLITWKGRKALIKYFTEITEIYELQQQVEQQKKALNCAAEFSGMQVFQYDIQENTAMLMTETPDSNGLPRILENFDKVILNNAVIPTEYQQAYCQMLQDMKEGKKQSDAEIRISEPDGTWNWVHCQMNLTEFDENGMPLRAICSVRNIDQEKGMQARMNLEMNKILSDKREMLGYVITNLTRNYVLEREQNTDGYHLPEKGRPLEQQIEAAMPFILESDRDRYRALHDRNMLIRSYEQGKTRFEFMGHFANKNGEYCWTRSVLNLVEDPISGEVYLHEHIYDIHASKMLEEITATVSTRDYERISSVNLRTKQMTIIDTDSIDSFGKSSVCDYSTHINEYAKECVVESDRTMFLQHMSPEYITKVLSENDGFEFYYHVMKNDGSQRCCRAKYAYYDQEQGICIITRTDVTETMHQEKLRSEKLENALNQAKEAQKIAEVATRAKSDFLSRMSHDMRTPLNAIIGLCALTLDDAKNPTMVRDNMTKMRSASDFLLGLVNDILDMAKIEDGSVVLNPGSYSYFDFLSNIRTMFVSQCDAKGITLTFKEPDINPVIRVDKLRMNQILFNVFSNAVKYTPAGGSITYTVENLVFGSDCLTVDFVISDTGIGMSEEYQKHMFEPFQREKNNVTAELQGSGLGLSITKQLVELMGGTILVTSKKNVGTTVRLSFRLECLEKDHKEEKIVSEVSKNSDAILIGKHVLLAEDHPLNAQIAKKLLEKKQMIVNHAENGKLVVEMFAASEEQQIDAILMDIRMPEMSGLDATRAIRALDRPDAKAIPIIAMSANAYAEDVKKSLDAGMNGHLAKPVNPEVLYQELAKHIGENTLQ